MPQLVVKGVSKNFGEGDSLVHALSDINLSVEKGEFLAIMGASGSGKTT
ncbi:TPA: ATP-binding cassette domain-containing protein, partial [Streptococcus suis]|nr:ATP-binding cassette domain-containing protein [Streptococcus suis]